MHSLCIRMWHREIIYKTIGLVTTVENTQIIGDKDQGEDIFLADIGGN